MGYHLREIEKGVLGEYTKIEEEFDEFHEALEQDNKLMAMLELSDMIGAIEAYVEKRGMTLDDLIKMKDATKRAFQTGHRK